MKSNEKMVSQSLNRNTSTIHHSLNEKLTYSARESFQLHHLNNGPRNQLVVVKAFDGSQRQYYSALW